jgi:hypothetical protein
MTSTLKVVGEIRPEISLYIQRHGFPDGGVFETDKLGLILSELQK